MCAKKDVIPIKTIKNLSMPFSGKQVDPIHKLKPKVIKNPIRPIVDIDMDQ